MLGHLSVRVTETMDGQAGGMRVAHKLALLEWPLSAATCCVWCPRRRWVRQLFPVVWMTTYCNQGFQ